MNAKYIADPSGKCLFCKDGERRIDTRRIVMINYGFYKVLNIPYGKALELAKEELKKEGFGILTQIDVQKIMKEKLGLDMNKYMILGACNPPSAYRAILTEENIGLMLPCNVIVYE